MFTVLEKGIITRVCTQQIEVLQHAKSNIMMVLREQGHLIYESDLPLPKASVEEHLTGKIKMYQKVEQDPQNLLLVFKDRLGDFIHSTVNHEAAYKRGIQEVLSKLTTYKSVSKEQILN